jgi:hypothetical protein
VGEIVREVGPNNSEYRSQKIDADPTQVLKNTRDRSSKAPLPPTPPSERNDEDDARTRETLTADVIDDFRKGKDPTGPEQEIAEEDFEIFHSPTYLAPRKAQRSFDRSCGLKAMPY